ncbi:hypothetical protein OQA88_1323 [Cercophora sp. LCS_1]
MASTSPGLWALKIFLTEGNQDFVFNSIPVFFIRDPIKFSPLNRSHKRHGGTNFVDVTMGTPKSPRFVNGYSGHTYKLVNADGGFNYVKFHFKADQENATNTAEEYRWNVFDMTKVWPHENFPLLEVGKLRLNRNPSNYFADIEQAAFSPSTNVPGIAPSADPILQAPMFAYPDAARYRLGVNYQLLPCNPPVVPVYAPYQRDGLGRVDGNYGGDPNYVRSGFRAVRFQGAVQDGAVVGAEHDVWVKGAVENYASEVTNEDFVQARALWNVLGRQEGQRENFVKNVVGHLVHAKEEVWEGTFEMFDRVDTELGAAIRLSVFAAKGSQY